MEARGNVQYNPGYSSGSSIRPAVEVSYIHHTGKGKPVTRRAARIFLSGSPYTCRLKKPGLFQNPVGFGTASTT
jgi:hypothetical protein